MKLTTSKKTMFNYNNLMRQYIDYIDVSKKTVETYQIALNQFNSYLQDNNIKQPTRQDVLTYREELKRYLKPTTVNSYMIALRNFFKFLDYSNLYENITENVKGVKLEQRHLKLGLSEEELERVLNACTNLKEQLIVKMLVILGLRTNELINIKLEDFYIDTDIIMLKIQGKGRNGEKQDLVKIDAKLFDFIKEYVKVYNITSYLFVSDSYRNKGQQITTRTIRYIVKDIFKRANLENINLKSCHSLRHTTTELLLKENIPIQEVSQYMRHKNISTTMIYAKELNQKESLCSNLLTSKLF